MCERFPTARTVDGRPGFGLDAGVASLIASGKYELQTVCAGFSELLRGVGGWLLPDCGGAIQGDMASVRKRYDRRKI